MKYILWLLFLLTTAVYGQQIIKDLTVQDFKVESVVKGSKPCPLMTQTQRDAIGSPLNGQCIYNTTTSKLNVYNGTVWKAAGGGVDAWATATVYAVGDLVIQANQIYQCLVAHTSGVFATDLAALNWEEISQGVTSHLDLTDIGTNSHATIDSHISSTSNPHSVTKSQVGLGSVVDADTTTTANITDSSNKRFMTDTQETNLDNQSGTNTGDNSVNSLYSGLASSKQDTLISGTNIKTINSNSLLGGGDIVIGELLTKNSTDSAVATTQLDVPHNQLTTTATGIRRLETGNANVLIDPNLEAVTTSWSTYADAAGAAPIDGTAGTANITVSNSTSSPLEGLSSLLLTKDAVNRQGQGISIPFTISNSSKGRVLQASFDYQIASGTFADNDLSVWVYDVSNARMIQPAPYLIKNSGIIERFAVEFQTAIDSTSYRLIIHQGSTSALAYTVKFDNFNVGQQAKLYGSAVTDSVSFTPTSPNSSLGTLTSVQCSWKKVGGEAVLDYKVTVGTTTGSEARLSLPAGLVSADTSIIPSIRNADGFVVQAGTGDIHNVLIEPSSTYLTFGLQKSGVAAGLTKVAGSTLAASSATLSFTARVPIQGWSSSQIFSSDADTRVVSFNASTTGTKSLSPNGSAVKVPFDLVSGGGQKDTHAAFNTSLNRYIVPVAGDYQFNSTVYISGTNALNSNYDLRLYKNGVVYRVGANLRPATGAQFTLSISSKIPDLKAGDYIELFFFGVGNNSVSTLTTDSGFNTLSFEGFMIQGPAQIAASESVSFSSNTSTTAASTSTPFIYTVKDHDTHNAYSTVTGKFTAPISGKYQCNISSYSVSSYSIFLYKNSTLVYSGSYASGGASVATGNHTLNLLAGDTVEVRPSASVTASAGAANNNFSCFRIGL